MIVSGLTSYAQSSDSLVCFTVNEARQIAKAAAECSVLQLEVDNYTRWNKDLQLQVDLLKAERADLQRLTKTLTANLNAETEKRKKARKQRLWWGVGGVLAGALTYAILR